MMLRIGITQRVEVITAYRERRDCLDQRWADLLELLDMLCLPLANRPALALKYLNALSLDGIIISGGNNLEALGMIDGVASERDAFEHRTLAWAADKRLPVLGVCRGMQMINHYCGGTLIPVDGHVAVRHRILQGSMNPQWEGLDEVNSFHNYAVSAEGLADCLLPLATAQDGTIEACRHRSLPWYGIMWHPEREENFQTQDLTFMRKLFYG